MKTRCDTTEYVPIEVGLHQGAALRPLLFIMVMYVLASDVGTHPPWGLLFADGFALCAESSVEVEEELEKLRRGLEENGLKISMEKTKYPRPRNSQVDIVYLFAKTITNSRIIQQFGLNYTSRMRMREICDKYD